MTSQSDLLADRYGTSRVPASRKRLGVIALAVVLLLGFLALALSVAFAEANKLETKDLGYQILSPQQALVKFEVKSPNDTEITCAIKVLSQSFAVVGYREVPVSALAGQPQQFETLVNTTQLGVSGLVDKCWRK
ncbi:DUF4307 domain-containing protein [Rhodoluna sp.]|uniref:DUF4307 domain-containing protein n=1 Tax=Rhodoluna sp. TaxID=1969481 RepID=UPI0025D1535C|nr:DUF4307 domain-containing protein [Rhodoluna sp.]